jgi:hypothetical protein
MMRTERLVALFAGLGLLGTLPAGVFMVYLYFFAEPYESDSFAITEAPATCEVLSNGDLDVQVPFRALDSYESIERITLIGAHGLSIVGARLKEPGGQNPSAELPADENGWVELGAISEKGETLVLHLQRATTAANAKANVSAKAIRLGVYPGENKWRDDLSVEISFDGTQCRVVASGASGAAK